MNKATTMTTSPGLDGDSGFQLKGWHVLAMLLTFFGVVMGVNFTMMRFAYSTFSGVERASAYQDGLKYNEEIAAARQQDALGWAVDARVQRSGEGVAQVAVSAKDAAGVELSNLGGLIVLERPADRREDRRGDLVLTGAGRYAATLDDVAPGQWDVVVEFKRGAERAFLSRTRVVLK